MLSAIARGGGGPGLISQLLSARRSRHLMLLRAVLDRTSEVGHPDGARVRDAYGALAIIQTSAPEAVRSLLDDALVGSWALRTVRELYSPQPMVARPADLALIVVAAAVRGGVSTTIDLSQATQAGGIHLAALGSVSAPGVTWGATEVRADAAGCELQSGSARVRIPAEPHVRTAAWQGFPIVSTSAAGLHWTVRLDLSGAHGMSGVCLDDLSDSMTLQHWCYLLRDGWRTLANRHRRIAAEVGAGLSVLVPLAGRPEQWSATPDDAIGAMAMTRPRDARAVAVTLAHEIQHLKLAGVMKLVPLIATESPSRWYAPWRDDPRPVAGLLHGAYAHLGVAGFWRQERHHTCGDDELLAHTEFARWRRAVGEIARLLAGSPQLTPVGRGFADGMAWTLDRWAGEAVPAEAELAADHLLHQHRLAWEAAHGAAPAT